jgi:poly-gamma-glutamate synthesis protein (capsule biosynthesis protein)
VDEIERNDQSFIFILQTDGSRMETLRLYPTVIRNFQAERARGLVAEQIALKMISLCNQLNTAACWNPAEQCLEIAF